MAHEPRSSRRSGGIKAARWLAAASVIASGAVHLQQYVGVYYRVIPVIGPLFLADFVLALLIGVALLVPVERVWRPLSQLVALGGVLFSLGAIIGLAISESSTLFGFHEHGYRLAVVLAIVFEGAAVVLLIADLAARPRRPVEPTEPPRVFASATEYRGDTS